MNLILSETPKTGFVATRPISCLIMPLLTHPVKLEVSCMRTVKALASLRTCKTLMSFHWSLIRQSADTTVQKSYVVAPMTPTWYFMINFWMSSFSTHHPYNTGKQNNCSKRTHNYNDHETICSNAIFFCFDDG